MTDEAPAMPVESASKLGFFDRIIGNRIDRSKQHMVYRLVFENAKDHIPGYLLSFMLLAVVSATTGLTAYLMEDVINEIFVNQRQDTLFLIAGAVAAIFIAKGIAAYFSTVTLARIGNNIVARIQRRIFEKLVAQGLDHLGNISLGDILTRFTHNTNAARDVINMLVLSLWRDILSLVALVIVMLIQDITMSLIVLFLGPIAGYVISRLMRAVKSVAKQEIAGIGRMNSVVKETFVGARVVKTFQLEKRMETLMDDAVRTVEVRLNEIARLSSITVPLMEAIAGVSIGLVILYGGWQVVHSGAQPGAFFSFITAVLLAYEPARRLARFNVDFQVRLAGATVVYEFLDEPLTEADLPNAAMLPALKGDIRVDGLSFAYGDVPTLSNVSLTIPSGGVTALVGPSGAGKSTLFSLLLRLYKPSSGQIFVDGHELDQYTIASLRRQVATVSQDAWQFEGTIFENIAAGREGASHEDVFAAAQAANLMEFIDSLPDGFDTQVGEGGSKLSGGQRQRVSIARAMLKDAPILLLDEATSSLDSITEAQVQAALAILVVGRTTLVIAHRLSTIIHAQQIIVMDKGQVVQTGSHDELLQAGGLYNALYAAQFRSQTD
ncbi:MAG: ABC transporter ATP-binding protein [Alphaproteobacteria bacterium]